MARQNVCFADSMIGEETVRRLSVCPILANERNTLPYVAPDPLEQCAKSLAKSCIPKLAPGNFPINPELLRNIASRTGGKAYWAKTWQKQVEAFEDIREDLGNSYTVTYYPKTNPNEAFRKITIEARQLAQQSLEQVPDQYRSGAQPVPHIIKAQQS